MDNNADSNLKFYLSQLNESPLLTREEENILLRNIEVLQNKILKECVSSKFFKLELLELLKEQTLSDIVKISRKLNDDSSKSQVSAITSAFSKLIKSLEKEHNLVIIRKLLSAVSLSGTLIHTLVTRIKKKYSIVLDSQKALTSFLAYFEVDSEEQLNVLIHKLKTNDLAKAYYARKFYTNEQRLMGKVHEYNEHLINLKLVEDVGITKKNLSEVKKLYISITNNETSMKQYKDELVSKNLRLVVSRAKKFVNRGLDLEDLIQEGNIGLIRAINKHDSSRGTKISTYATWWVDQAIRRAISNKSKTVRIPTHVEFLQTQLAPIVAKLTNELGRIPTKDEIASRAKINVEVLKRLEKIAIYKIGIDEEMSTGVSMMDTIPSDPADSPFNLTARKLLRERVRQILSTLPPRTEKIIRLRFGIGEPHEEMTLQQIADTVGLTKPGVRLVQNKGLDKIKKRGKLNEF